MVKLLRRVIIRNFRTSSLFHNKANANLGPILEKKSDIEKLLDESTWKVTELVSNSESEINNIHIDSKTIKKMLKLSGLKADISDEQEQSLLRSLKSQMAFIKSLYNDDNEFNTKEDSNETHFRLIASDHKPGVELTLDKLISDIKNLPKHIDPDKGEIESSFTIDQLNPNNKTYFTIKQQK